MTTPIDDRVDAPDTGEGNDRDRFQVTEEYRKNIAAHTKRLRTRAGIRQRDVAKLMNTGQNQVASVEHARLNIGLYTLTRLAMAFNVEPASLLVPLDSDDQASEPSGAHVRVAEAAPQPRSVQGSPGLGVSLTTMKEMAAATHRRLETLERRHGSVPMTRAMLTSVIVALLDASQNLDGDDGEPNEDGRNTKSE